MGYIGKYNAALKKDIIAVGLIGGWIDPTRLTFLEWHNESRLIDLSSSSVCNNIVAACKKLVHDKQYGLDGIHLDIEPTYLTDANNNYLNLIKRVRVEIGYNKHLSVACGMTDWAKNNNLYIKEVSKYVNMLAVMCYDQELIKVQDYRSRFVSTIKRYRDNMEAGCKLYMVQPAYARSRTVLWDKWHTPVETIQNASAGIDDAASAGYHIDGSGIWVWIDGSKFKVDFVEKAQQDAWLKHWVRCCGQILC